MVQAADREGRRFAAPKSKAMSLDYGRFIRLRACVASPRTAFALSRARFVLTAPVARDDNLPAERAAKSAAVLAYIVKFSTVLPPVVTVAVPDRVVSPDLVTVTV